MLRYIAKKLLYGLLVLLGVVILVFFLFLGFGDPSRVVAGQSSDSTTQANIIEPAYIYSYPHIAKGSDFTFADGYTIQNISSDTEHTSYYKATNGCDSLYIQRLLISQTHANVVPNPAFYELFVDYYTEEEGYLILYNTMGQALVEMRLPPDKEKIQINIDVLSTGIYYYYIYLNENNTYKGKLVIRP